MKKNIAIIGGGASALVLACELDPDKFNVSIYEKNATLGRKFLVAGDGGLNFTHSENKELFISRYSPASFLTKAFQTFSNTEYIRWMNHLGLDTFVGSSGRLFPKKGIKPIQVLDKILKKIETNNVQLFFKHKWEGFCENNALKFSNSNGKIEVQSDISIFCLGGASWSVTGSDGAWTGFFKEKNITITNFQSSNCAFKVNWQTNFIPKIEGKTIKNCVFSCGDKIHAGEIVLTKFGIEGSGIYPLSPEIRLELQIKGKASIFVDLKPGFSHEKIREKLQNNSSSKNITSRLKENLNLSDAQVQLIKMHLIKEQFLDEHLLSESIKKLEIVVEGLAQIDEAISTVGGISLSEINEEFELIKMKNVFAIGEMLDYDAPTGGYLLQSCFSMANHLATHLNTVYCE